MSALTRMRDERGFVIGTAMSLLAIIMLLGATALALVISQSHESGHETNGEAAFNLAESALDAETSQLQTQWPGTAPGWNAVCNQSTTPTTGCPGTSLTSAFNSSYAGSQYAGSSVSWQLQVFDNTWNPDSDYYNDSLASTAPNYDYNNGQPDGKLWVRAQATVAGQTRVVAAQVVRQSEVVSLPRNVITAGGTYTSNNGNKVIINSVDYVNNSGLTGTVDLRCGTASPPTQPVYGSDCAGWDQDHGQLQPPTYSTGYVDPTGIAQSITPFQLGELKQTAIDNGTYYPPGQCPPAGQAGVVYIEKADCSYKANTDWNSEAAPGMLIVASGTLDFDGTLNFHGIIYMADQQGPATAPCTSTALQQDGTVFTVHGNGTLYGALFVGNCGVVDAGSSAFNIWFDSNAFRGATAYQEPALAKNTFQLVPHK